MQDKDSPAGATVLQITATALQFPITINGVELIIDFATMHPSWVTAHLRKAAQRFLNDKYSGEEPATKLELIRMDLAAMASGAPMPEKTRATDKGLAAKDPVADLARDLYIASLCEKLAQAKGVPVVQVKTKTLLEFAQTAPLVKVSEKGAARLDMAEVDKRISACIATRDFRKEAQEELARRASQTAAIAELDFSALGL